MPQVATLTLNPTIDASSEAPSIRHTHKIRTTNERFDPGGGGINAARVLNRLGGDAEALYFAGGSTGTVLSRLLDQAGLRHRALPIGGDLRISLTVHERLTGKEYRFVPDGPEVTASEAARCFSAVAQLTCQWLVLSGSLPPGMPHNSYAVMTQAATARGIQVVLDTSGPALVAALEAGGLALVKPSRGELEYWAGRALPTDTALIEAARSLVAGGSATCVAVTLGHDGALLVLADDTIRLPAIPVEARSAVGAGDSFLGGMVHGLVGGADYEAAFRLGLAAGTAAVLTPGTDLCLLQDVQSFAASLGVDDLLKFPHSRVQYLG